MKINKKAILALLIIFSLIFLAGCDSGSSTEESQAEAEASQTIRALNAGGVDSLDEHLAEDFNFESSDSNQSSDDEIAELKDKYFNSGDSNLNFELAEDGTVEAVSNSEIKIYTKLIITIDFSQNTHSYSMPVTLTLEKAGEEWKITNWEEGRSDESDDDQDEEDDDNDFDDDDDDQDDEEQDDLLTPEDKAAAEAVLDDSLSALENEDLNSLAELWTDDFEYENSELEMTKDELIDQYQQLFDGGREHTEITLVNREYDFDDGDEIEIYGLLTFSGIKSTGEEYTGKGYYAKFELEKVGDSWLISEWEENSSNFDEDDDDDQDDDDQDVDDDELDDDQEDSDDYADLSAEELLDDMLESIENENAAPLEDYLADDFIMIQDGTSIDKEEMIAGLKGNFNNDRYYDDYYITNQETEVISETEVKITGLFVITGIDKYGEEFEEIEEDQVTFTLEKRNERWYVVEWRGETPQY